MSKRTTLNKKTIAILSLIILIGLFLSVLFVVSPEDIKLWLFVVMSISLVIWMSYATGGYPSLGRSACVLVYFSFMLGLYFSIQRIPALTSLSSTPLFQSVFTLISIVILGWTRFPQRIKSAVEHRLSKKQNSESMVTDNDSSDHDENDPIPYRTYRHRRLQDIMRSKPTSLLNVSTPIAILRHVVFLVYVIGGTILIVIGIMAYPFDIVLSSLTVWSIVLGVGLMLISPFILFEGFRSALLNAVMIIPILMGLTVVLIRALSLVDHSWIGFVMVLILFLLIITLLLTLRIKQIHLHYTIALIVFKREEVWIGLEQVLRESLPIKQYNHMVTVKIKVDEEFELSELMVLGPKFELFAHFRKLIFAGLRFDEISHSVELYFCVKDHSRADRHLNRFLKQHFHYPFTLTQHLDPKAILEARLTPTQEELIEANNRNTVFLYEDEGVDLSLLHHIILILTFKDETSMRQAELDLNQEGYDQIMITDTRRLNDVSASEDNGWFVISVQSETRLGLDRINILTRQIQRIIQPNQGTLSYWVLGKFQEAD